MVENIATSTEYDFITDKTVIHNALDRVVNSPEFNGSKRSIQILKYIVEKHLKGEGKQINGTTIAQDVLNAGVDFDPSTNPIVRVQAGRLRKLLSEYYRRSGKNDDVLIYVAKGQYAPQFGKRSELQTIIDTPKNHTRSPLTYTKWLAVSLAAIAILVFLFYGQKNTPASSPLITQTQATYPSIAILPFQNLTNDPNHDVLKQGFQHQLGSDLSRFRVIRVVFSDLQYEQIFAEKLPISDYVLEGTFLSVASEIDLIIKLINVQTGKTISQHRVKRKNGDNSYFNALVDISENLSRTFAGHHGSLVEESLQNIKLDLANNKYTDLKAFECLSLFHQFEANKSAENFNHAASCLSYQVSQNKNDSSLLAALAWVMAYGSPETGLFKDYQIEGDYSLTKALQTAEKAIALNPGDSLAYQYTALIQWRKGLHTAAIQSIRRSIQLNPASSENLSNLGSFLSFTGDWENGLHATHEAIAQNPNASYWYFTPLFMRAVLDRNGKEAVRYAKKLADTGGYDGSVYMLIAACITGDAKAISRLKPIVKAYAREHEGDPIYVTRRWVQSPTIINALESELESISISIPEN